MKKYIARFILTIVVILFIYGQYQLLFSDSIDRTIQQLLASLYIVLYLGVIINSVFWALNNYKEDV